jgi:hypothetical protein
VTFFLRTDRRSLPATGWDEFGSMPEKVSVHEASSLLCANHNFAKASLHLVDNAQPPLKLLNARAGLSAFRSDLRGLLHVAPSASAMDYWSVAEPYLTLLYIRGAVCILIHSRR